MPYSALTVTRDDINAFEGQTFSNINVTGSGTSLNLSLTDTLVLTKAKEELQSDVMDAAGHYYYDGSYASMTDLLDAVYAADDNNLLKNLLCYKFLELWFVQDASSEQTFAWQKFQLYHAKYVMRLASNMRIILSNLPTKRSAPIFRLDTVW